MEHQIFRCAKMILRDRCSTSYDMALVQGRQLCTQHSIFVFAVVKEVSQNCFVFNVVKFKN